MAYEHLIRPVIRDLTPVVPTRPLDEIAAVSRTGDVIRLGNNESNWGVSPRVSQAIARAATEANFYPDSSCAKLRRALADRHEVEPDMVVVGSGAGQIIQLIAQAFLNPGDQVVLPRPTFPLYARFSRLMDADVVEVDLSDFRIDPAGMMEAITEKTKLVFVCNPNNPTGAALKPEALEDFIEALPGHVILALDDLYMDFADADHHHDPLPRIRAEQPIVALRSFSKLPGLAGLRVGYALASAELSEYLNRARPAFPVDHLAQAAALAALDDTEFTRDVLARTIDGRVRLHEGLQSLGLAPVSSQTNFVFVDYRVDAVEVMESLWEYGIATAAVGPPGATYGRIGVGSPDQNQRVIDALAEILPRKR